MFRIITGLIVVAAALWFVYLAISLEWIFVFHALIVGGVGIAILLNKKEDEIEEITHDYQEE